MSLIRYACVCVQGVPAGRGRACLSAYFLVRVSELVVVHVYVPVCAGWFLCVCETLRISVRALLYERDGPGWAGVKLISILWGFPSLISTNSAVAGWRMRS